MVDVGLFDGSFGNSYSMSLAGDNKDEKPEFINWVRGEERQVTILTDMLLEKVGEVSRNCSKIGLLIEPPSITETAYRTSLEYRDEFDCFLTFVKDITESEPDFLYYPFGGSWIKTGDWGIHPKSKRISLIASQKKRAPGHKLRHEIAATRFDVTVSVFGRSYVEIDSKTTALKDYAYSIVVENAQIKGYFTEKVIDCMCQGTIPVYYGCPDIGEFFDTRGMHTFSTMEELRYIVNDVISEDDYYNRIGFIKSNLDDCWNYRCSEDWLYKNYRWMFEACEQ